VAVIGNATKIVIVACSQVCSQSDAL